MKKALVYVFALIAALLLVSCELTGTAPEKGSLHVVAIGNNFEKVLEYSKYVYYDNVKYNLGEIPSCRDDANAVCQVLEYWGKKSGMNLDIHNLSDGYYSSFESSLNIVKNNAGPNDLTVIFVSTHGGNDIERCVNYSQAVSNNSFFVLEKSSSDLDCAYKKTSELMEYVNEIPGKVLILGDFCYSGSLISQDNFTYNSANYTDSGSLDLFFSNVPAKDSNKIFVLSSSAYYELSNTGDPLSRCTWYLLKSLGMNNYNKNTGKVSISPDTSVMKNGKIILSDIYSYVYRYTSRTQVPQMNTGANDLILFNLK